MDVRSRLSIGAAVLAAGLGCAVLASVSWGDGKQSTQVAAASPAESLSLPSSAQRATPIAAKADSLKSDDLKKLSLAKELNLEPSLLEQRVRLSGRTPEAPMSVPPSEPTMTRREFLRLKDRVEAKENWMFVDQEKLNQDREKSAEGDVFKDKWELKQDLKKKEWWEYSNKNSTSPTTVSGKEATDPSQLDEATRAQLARKLREEDTKSRESLASSSTRRTGTDSSSSTHQYSALNMKDIFTPGADSKTGRSSELGLSEIFGSNSRLAGDRDPSALRRQEFRDFLNVSRVPKPAAPSESPASASPFSAAPSPGGFSDSLRAGSGPAGRDSIGGVPELGRNPGASRFGNYYDPGRSGGFGPQAGGAQSFRNLESSRNLVTPAMMEPPKRRF